MKMRKIAAFSVAAVMAAGICTGVPIGAENNSPWVITAEAADSDFVIEADDDGDEILVEYKGNGGDVVIPKEIKAIGTEVFAGNSDITSVTFKGSSVQINPYAFSECENLKKVVFEGDAELCIYAFYCSYNLESVTIKGSIKDGIYCCAFFNCQNLKTVKIGKNENEFVIGALAFQNCYSLTSINIPSKCTDIYGCAFLNCFSLESLTIPANTKINEEDSGKDHFGYAALYNSQGESLDAYLDLEAVDKKIFVADGKTSGYALTFGKGNIGTGNYTDIWIDSKEYTPKKLTLTVTKGSPAEKWAKKNKVAYTYKSSSSGSGTVAAPTGFKASKTTNSVTLSWSESDGADVYRVYIYNAETGKYEKYKDVKNPQCQITNLDAGTKYKFKVAAYDKVDGKYVKGGTSKAVSVTTKK